MASMRRTLALAYHDHHYGDGDSLPSGNSPSHELLSNGKCSLPLPAFSAGVSRFIAGIIPQRHPRTGQGWRNFIFRCSLFFLLGVVLGVMPFGNVDDFQNHDFSFGVEIKPSVVHVESDNDDLKVKPNNLVVDMVSYGEELQPMVNQSFDFATRKHLIVVTPTRNWPFQAYFLNRLAQVFSLVEQPLLWIVVEMDSASMETADILRKTGLMYRHLVCARNVTDVKDRVVHMRNTALEHIEQHKLDGIVYFAADDNIHTMEMFRSLREISRFGTWTVAKLAQSKNKAILEGPVCNETQVIGWHTNERRKRLRRFHADMSGFAFNSTILWDPKRWRRPTSVPIRQLEKLKEGFQDSAFVAQLVEDEGQMEGVPSGCLNIMNWQLHLEGCNFSYPRGWLLKKKLDVIFPL